MLRRDCWGHGYATEAAQAVLRDAFERLGAAEVIADIRPENAASIRVAERLGMRAEYEVVKPLSRQGHAAHRLCGAKLGK